MKFYRRFVADRTVWANLVVVYTPSLAFSLRLVEAEEPVRVQTLGSELAVERLDEGIVRRLAWPREVERHVVHVGPQIELLAHELRSVVDADRLWITKLGGTAIKRFHDMCSA